MHNLLLSKHFEKKIGKYLIAILLVVLFLVYCASHIVYCYDEKLSPGSSIDVSSNYIDWNDSIIIQYEKPGPSNSTNDTSNDSNKIQTFKNQVRDLGMSEEEIKISLKLVKLFHYLAKKLRIPYFIYGGTLLGAVRNGTFLPWDDDIDVSMHEKYKDRFEEQVSQIKYYETKLNGRILKLYSTKYYKTITYKNWNWPFLDIFLQQTLSDGSLQVHTDIFAKSDLYPTRDTKFMGLTLPAPRNVTKVLKRTYGKDVLEVCESNYYNHKKEEALDKTIKIKCDPLLDIYNMKQNRTGILIDN